MLYQANLKYLMLSMYFKKFRVSDFVVKSLHKSSLTVSCNSNHFNRNRDYEAVTDEEMCFTWLIQLHSETKFQIQWKE